LKKLETRCVDAAVSPNPVAPYVVLIAASPGCCFYPGCQDMGGRA
jgi:hypothetical protein